MVEKSEVLKMFSTTFKHDTKEWTGHDIPPLYNPNISVAQALFNSMSKYGSKIAQISDNNGIHLSFDEIRMQSIRVAQNLQSRGYKPSQVFGIITKNYHNIAPVVFASISIGCPVNTLDPSFGKTQLMHMLKTTKPVLMFCDVDCHDLVKECRTELETDFQFEILTVGGSADGSESIENLFAETGREDEFLPIKVNGMSDIAAILCSSGTTGLSKGVCLSHAAILDAIAQVNLAVSSNDVSLCFSSLYWVSGIFTLIRATITGTTRLITTEPFTPELQLRFIEQYKVTSTLNSPYQITLMLKCDRFHETDLSSLKFVLIGGSKVPLHIKKEMDDCLPNGHAYVVYGMSEIGGLLSIDYPVSPEKDTIGKLIGGSCVKIVDDDGNRCGVNVDGEICIKTNYKFIGYYNNREATDELFDEEDFLKSGDIGHFDEDGDLFIIDRKKDLLKYCNFQISPSEIDSYLIESSDIKSACVVGIPDPLVTDLPAAVVVRAHGSSITEEEIVNMVADHFADYCKLRGGVYFVDNLPLTPSGKMLRRQVKETAIELYNSRAHQVQ